MSGRGRGRKRKGGASGVVEENPQEQPERVEILSDPDRHGTMAKGNANTIIDFEQILQQDKTIDLSKNTNVISSNNCTISETSSREIQDFEQIPEMVRCGGDDLSVHVPDQIKQKIRQHQYINLAVLLKGAVDLNDLGSGNILTVNEKGQLLAQPRMISEKIKTIEQWTDAFLVYSSIYLHEHPSATVGMIRYMALIREAAQRNVGLGWRMYDEQFRLRQAIQLAPWHIINSDLWLRCFSTQIQTPVAIPTRAAVPNSPKCIDFNTGNCHWANCRYLHACFVCSSSLHGKRNCPRSTSNPFSTNRQTTQPFRPQTQRSFRGRPSSFRGTSGNSFRFSSR